MAKTTSKSFDSMFCARPLCRFQAHPPGKSHGPPAGIAEIRETDAFNGRSIVYIDAGIILDFAYLR